MSFKILLSDGLHFAQHNLSCHNMRSTNVRCLGQMAGFDIVIDLNQLKYTQSKSNHFFFFIEPHCVCPLQTDSVAVHSHLPQLASAFRPICEKKNWSVQMWRSIWSHQWSTSILTPRLEIYSDSLSCDSDESVTSPPSFFLFSQALLPVKVKNNQNLCGWNGIAMSKKGTDSLSSLPPIGPRDFIHCIHFPFEPTYIAVRCKKAFKTFSLRKQKQCADGLNHRRNMVTENIRKELCLTASQERILNQSLHTGFNRHNTCVMWVESSDSAVGTWIKKDVALGENNFNLSSTLTQCVYLCSLCW